MSAWIEVVVLGMKKLGFTLLELLIALAIVGALATAAIYTLNVARAKSRDAKRVSDVSVLRSGLSESWLQLAVYPVGDGVNLGQAGQNADALTSNGFVGAGGSGNVILSQAPVAPKSGEFYFYKGGSAGYSLRFTTERATAYGPASTYYAHAAGVDQIDELK